MNPLNFVLYLLFLIKANAQLGSINEPETKQIHLYFNSIGPQSLFCDDYAEIFGTEKLKVYKIGEDGSIININSLLEEQQLDYCFSSIVLDVTSINEKIIIEFEESPSELRDFFAQSTVSRIERFDYPDPDDDTDYSGMFYCNNELTYVDFSNLSFMNVEDLGNMFYNCSKLETIIFPTNEKPSSVTDFSSMFAFSVKLTSIDISFFSLSNAKDMGYMFKGCKQLQYVRFPENEIAEKIETMTDMFADCTNLISVDLSNFSYKKLKNVGYLFNRCSNLETVIMPSDVKATSIQNCKNMFYGCSKLTSIDLSKFTFVTTKDLSSFFSKCTSLETIIFPQDETATNVEDFSYMFSGCKNLTSINLNNIDFKNAKKLSNMFSECSSLTHVNLPTSEKANKVEYYQNMFLYCESLVSIDLSKFSFINAKDITTMFFNCSNLEELILPQNEVVTNIEDLSYMFSNCFKLTSINLSGIDFAYVKNISYIFANCINLQNIIFGDDAEINNIEKVRYAFANCHKLVSIDLSKFNLQKVEDFSYLFYSCINLENIIFSTTKINNAKIFDHTFYNCSKITTIDLSNIGMNSVINMNYMFSECELLESIKFGKNQINTNMTEMNNTFSNCKSLISLDLSFINSNGNINLNECFSNCNSLKEINIFNLNTNNAENTINFFENVALDGCLYYNYDNIHFGDSITNIFCQNYIGYQKCGPCLNDNSEEYCSMDINGNIVYFHYIDTEVELPISERQCYWSKNFENVAGYTFENNTNKNEISYYINYCDNYILYIE